MYNGIPSMGTGGPMQRPATPHPGYGGYSGGGGAFGLGHGGMGHGTPSGIELGGGAFPTVGMGGGAPAPMGSPPTMPSPMGPPPNVGALGPISPGYAPTATTQPVQPPQRQLGTDPYMNSGRYGAIANALLA